MTPPGYRENYGPFMINKFENGNVFEVPSVRNTLYYPDGHFRHIHVSAQPE